MQQNSDKTIKRSPSIRKVSQIFVPLVIDFLQTQEKKDYLAKCSNEDDRKPNEILREELSKPIIENPEDLKTMAKNKIRNITKIVISLKEIPELKRYFKFNGIQQKTIEKIAALSIYEFVEKGKYIFFQNQYSDKFYGIISGKISFKTYCSKNKGVIGMKNTTLNRIIKPSIKEEEKSTVGPGKCFGEWALIYNKAHDTSAVALEDSELFYITKDYFINTLSKDIIRSDIDKKNFIMRKIPPIQKEGTFKKIVSLIVPCFYNRGEVVYNEKEVASSFYILFQGECILTKFPSVDSIEDPILSKEKMIQLIKVDKGGILGLESCYPNMNYQTNLVVSTDFTVLYKINPLKLKDCKDAMMKFLTPMFEEQMMIINNIWSKKKSRNNNLVINRNHSNKFLTPTKLSQIAEEVIKSCFDKKKENMLVKKNKILFANLSTLNISKVKSMKNLNISPANIQKSGKSVDNRSSIVLYKKNIKSPIKKIQLKGEESGKRRDCLKINNFKENINPQNKDIGTKFKKRKTFSKSLNKQNNSAAISQRNFNSGSFDLPLMCLS